MNFQLLKKKRSEVQAARVSSRERESLLVRLRPKIGGMLAATRRPKNAL